MDSQKIISNNLKKYNYDKEKYEKYLITLLIKGAHTHSILLYKEYLIFYENLEYLDTFLPLRNAINKLKDLLFVYENCSYIFPNYTPLPECKYIYNNILKKQNLINYIESLLKREKNKLNNKETLTSFTSRTNNEQKIFDSKIYEDIFKDCTNQSIIKKIFDKPDQQNTDSVKSIIALTDRIKNYIPPPPKILIFPKNISRNIKDPKKISEINKNNTNSRIQIYNSSFKPFPLRQIDFQGISSKNSSKNAFYPKKIFDLINNKNDKKVHKRNINYLIRKNFASSSSNISPSSINKKALLFTNHSFKLYKSKEKSPNIKKANSLFTNFNEKSKTKKIKSEHKFSQIHEQKLPSNTKYTKYLKNILLSKSKSNSGFFSISRKQNSNNTSNSKIHTNSSRYIKNFKTKPLRIQIADTLKTKLINSDKKLDKISKIEIKSKQDLLFPKKILDFSKKYSTSNTTSVSTINPSSKRIIVDVKKPVCKNNSIKRNVNSIFSERLMTEIHYKNARNINSMSNKQTINPFIIPKIKRPNFKVLVLNSSNSKDMKCKILDKKK